MGDILVAPTSVLVAETPKAEMPKAEMRNQAESPERSASDEDRTLREIFNRDKGAALDFAMMLKKSIPDIELDGEFEYDDDVKDENGPMRSLRLARLLCEALANLQCVKMIMGRKIYT
jgi:hypothetical protein